MKKIRLIAMTLILLFLMTGCSGKVNADVTSIIVKNKGEIIGAIIENFDKDYYSKDELKDFVQEKIDSYNEKAGEKRISIDTYDVEKGVARVYLKYASMRDYEDFNSVEFFCGSITEALISGYDFEDSFNKVENGEITGTESKDTIVEQKDYKVLVISENISVQVPGTIIYVSDGTVKVTDKKSAMVSFDDKDVKEDETTVEASTKETTSIEESTEDAWTKAGSGLAYIIYK